MDNIAVITGAGSGIGRAIARELAGRGYSVVGIGRQSEPLETTGEGCADFTPIVADLSDPDQRTRVATELGTRNVRFLIHNAGRLEPVGDLGAVALAEWRAAMAINLEAPLFLTQAMLGSLYAGSRVLHISSGAAHRPIRGWGSYCLGKASTYMLYRLLAEELADRGIAVGSLRPGVVDTRMQAHIRSLSPAEFPDVERFRALKAEGKLVDPADVARFASRLLEGTDDAHFKAGEWDIRDHWEALD